MKNNFWSLFHCVQFQIFQTKSNLPKGRRAQTCSRRWPSWTSNVYRTGEWSSSQSRAPQYWPLSRTREPATGRRPPPSWTRRSPPIRSAPTFFFAQNNCLRDKLFRQIWSIQRETPVTSLASASNAGNLNHEAEKMLGCRRAKLKINRAWVSIVKCDNDPKTGWRLKTDRGEGLLSHLRECSLTTAGTGRLDFNQCRIRGLERRWVVIERPKLGWDDGTRADTQYARLICHTITSRRRRPYTVVLGVFIQHNVREQ